MPGQFPGARRCRRRGRRVLKRKRRVTNADERIVRRGRTRRHPRRWRRLSMTIGGTSTRRRRRRGFRRAADRAARPAAVSADRRHRRTGRSCSYKLHHLTPEEVTIRKGGQVTFQIHGGGHGFAIYEVSKDTTREELGQYLCAGDDPEDRRPVAAPLQSAGGERRREARRQGRPRRRRARGAANPTNVAPGQSRVVRAGDG